MEDEDYEYEYDANETSTFLVELDLSTLNGIKRESTARRASRPKRPRKNADAPQEDAGEQSSHAEEDEIEGSDARQDLTKNERERSTEASFQVLDLGTVNPIVGYRGNFYSCAWHDVIGTDMFFALPHQDVDHAPLRSTKDYQLVGTSRIKLVGHRAQVFSKTQARRNQQSRSVPGGPEQLVTETLTPASNHLVQFREQGEFVQRMMEIEKSRRTTEAGDRQNHLD